MSTMYLVSCVAVKLETPAAAQDLYVSPWFLKARAYVTQQASPWRILSAKYGLVDPASVIAPYNETLNTMGTAARRAWAQRVLSELYPLILVGDKIVFLAGERYREHLLPPLQERGMIVDIPMRGLPIGKQLQWLDRHNVHG